MRFASCCSEAKSPRINASFFLRLHFFSLRPFSMASSIRSNHCEKISSRSSWRRVALECSRVVLGYSHFERRPSGSDVVASIGTPEDVEPSSICHSSARPILRDAAKTPLLRMRLTETLSIQNSVGLRRAEKRFVSGQKQKRRGKPRHFALIAFAAGCLSAALAVDVGAAVHRQHDYLGADIDP